MEDAGNLTEVPGVHVPDAVTVVGTGGFGAWAALFAARAGVKQIVLVNPTGKNASNQGITSHDVEEREVIVGPFLRKHIGSHKVDALRHLIKEFHPDAVVETHPIAFNPDRDGHLLKGTVFAGPSDHDVLMGIWRLAGERGLRCFTGTYNGTQVGVFSTPPNLRLIDAPVWVGSAALCAILAVNAAFVKPINLWSDISTFDRGHVDVEMFGAE